jgi:hypothetical protein
MDVKATRPLVNDEAHHTSKRAGAPRVRTPPRGDKTSTSVSPATKVPHPATTNVGNYNSVL